MDILDFQLMLGIVDPKTLSNDSDSNSSSNNNNDANTPVDEHSSSAILGNDLDTQVKLRKLYAHYADHLKSQDFSTILPTLDERLTSRKFKKKRKKQQQNCCTSMCSPLGVRSGGEPFLSDEQVHELMQERNALMCLTKIPMDYSNKLHCDLLSSLAVILTGKKQAELTGDYWERVGFLGPDPSKEFRGSGMLGALALLYFCTHNQRLTQDLLELSQSRAGDNKGRGFPLCVALLHMARRTLDMIQEGLLDYLCTSTDPLGGVRTTSTSTSSRSRFSGGKSGSDPSGGGNNKKPMMGVERALMLFLSAFALEFYYRWNAGNYSENDFQRFFEVELLPYVRKKHTKVLAQFYEYDPTIITPTTASTQSSRNSSSTSSSSSSTATNTNTKKTR